MTSEERTQFDYSDRQMQAVYRVLVDLGQVLGSFFKDSIVIVGGLVPPLLLTDADEPHVGSIDIDLALDGNKLREGRYAEVVKSLLETGRYKTTNQPFKMQANVDLYDDGPVVVVDVDFLKAPGKLHKCRDRGLDTGFRPLDADGCAAAFLHPERIKIDGQTISGTKNSVLLSVASIEDLLVMKAHALANRDKPKDAYDICYCLDQGAIESLALAWQVRRNDKLVADGIRHLREKFTGVDSYGPRQVATFYGEEPELHARRAFELVNRFLTLIDS